VEVSDKVVLDLEMIFENDRASVEYDGNFSAHNYLFCIFLDADQPKFRTAFLFGFLHPLANGLFTCERFTFIKNGYISEKAVQVRHLRRRRFAP
jgi:hypothetical protein